MPLTLDHIIIFCQTHAPEADKLLQAGFVEGEPNTHPGQGTSNRRFFFQNMMLEFLWVSDLQEAKSELTAPTNLWDRANSDETGFCPFGLAFRADENNPTPEHCPFPAWSYEPRYLPPTAKIFIADNDSSPNEPMIFYSYFPAKRGTGKSVDKNAQTVTAVKCGFFNGGNLSAAANQIKNIPPLQLFSGDKPLVQIELDHQPQNQILDFTPQLNLKILF